VWREQPGTLVWVAVPDEMADGLAGIAEGVRRLDGPATIPHVVVVTPLAGVWDAMDNNGNGVVYARVAGTVCTGLDWVPEDCSPVTARQHSSGTIRLAGTTPPAATQVRIDLGGDSGTVDTVAFAGAPEVRFFAAEAAGSPGRYSATWLAADGTELDTIEFTVDAPDTAASVDTTVSG
jgi:hypothetical protein